MTRRSEKHFKPPKVPRLIAQALATNRFILKNNNDKKMGRPSVITQEVVQKLEVAFSYDATVEEACLYGGIGVRTYYDFIEKYPDFPHRITALRSAPSLMARMCVVRAAEHDADLALKYLERKCPQEFSTRAQIHHTGEISDRHSVDPEQIALIKRAMGNFARKTRRDA